METIESIRLKAIGFANQGGRPKTKTFFQILCMNEMEIYRLRIFLERWVEVAEVIFIYNPH